MKLRFAALIVLLVIIADQALKFWIKTGFTYGHITDLAGLPWARLYFIENEGMAWGWKFGGEWGKMALTLFRLVAVLFGTWYLAKIVRDGASRGFIICASLIYAGALGNLIDSMFYGMIFSESTESQIASFMPAEGGYAGFLHGKVVDMLYFPMVQSTYPQWFPFVGGERFEFFSPIFNIADAAISVGVIILLIFQKRFFHHDKDEVEDEDKDAVATNTELENKAPVA